jgi:multidrug efflux pump subunit AcrB
METNKATITRQKDKTILVLKFEDTNLEIVLTEDNPNAVKNVFNNLIQRLKKGQFNFELEDDKQDLYFHISQEYIRQLNSELSSVYSELEDYELLDTD